MVHVVVGFVIAQGVVLSVADRSVEAATGTTPERLLNSVTRGVQIAPDVAAMPDGRVYAVWSDEDALEFGWIGGHGVRSAYLGADGNRVGPVFDLMIARETAYLSPEVGVVDLGPYGAFPMVSAVRHAAFGCVTLVFRTLSAEGNASGCDASLLGRSDETGLAALPNGSFVFNALNHAAVLNHVGGALWVTPLTGTGRGITSAGDGAALAMTSPSGRDAVARLDNSGAVVESLELPAQASIASLAGYRNGVVAALVREPVNGSAAVTVRVSDSRLGAAQVVSLPVDPSVELDLVTLADGGLFVSWLDAPGARVRGQFFDVSRSGVVSVSGPAFTVSEFRAVGRPSAAAMPDGRVAVVWASGDLGGLGDEAGVSGRLLDPVDFRSGSGGGGAAGVVASGGRCFAVGGGAVPGAVAAVNLTPVGASAPGNGQLLSSDVVSPPVASNVNFGQGTVDPNVAFAQVGADGKLCFQNSEHAGVDVVADHLGWFRAGVFQVAPTGPVRLVDTRVGLGGARLAPSERRCFAVSAATGATAVVNLTPVGASVPGNGQLVSSDVVSPPVASNVNFGPGTFDPNVAFARVGSDGSVCFVNSEHASLDLVADLLGTLSGFSPASSGGGSLRVVDTRIGQAGRRLAPSERLCFATLGAPGDVAVLNLTPVSAAGLGNGQLVSSNSPSPPLSSNVNFAPGSVDPNVALALIGADGKVCFVNSPDSSVDLVADLLGTVIGTSYTPAVSTGASLRVLDTRA